MTFVVAVHAVLAGALVGMLLARLGFHFPAGWYR